MPERTRGDFYTGGMNESDLFSMLAVREGYLKELSSIKNKDGYVARDAAMEADSKILS